MTKEEFLSKIGNTQKRLKRYKRNGGIYLCLALGSEVSQNARSCFQKTFRPKGSRDEYWTFYDDFYGNDNTAKDRRTVFKRREVALVLFTEMCLEYELYKKF